MELCIKENGILTQIKEMEEASRFGQMVLVMTDFGKMEWPVGMVDSFMLKEMFMKELGMKIKLMDLEFTPIIMVADMKVSGLMINNMETVLRNGQMVHNTKDNTLKE